MKKILIADDHDLVRLGLKKILLESFPFANIHEAKDGKELLKKAFDNKWDIIISDINMPSINGIDAMIQIKEKKPETRILILSINPAEQYALRILKAGADGYVNKDAAPQELTKAVTLILQGRKYFPYDVVKSYSKEKTFLQTNPHTLLSNREYTVFIMLAEGRSLSEIAQLLSVALTTVSTYRNRVLQKMKMKSNGELTRYAIVNKLVQ